MKSFLNKNKIVAFICLNLLATFVYAQDSSDGKFYCQENDVSGSPAWTIKYEGNEASIQGRLWMIDATNEVTFKLKKTSYSPKLARPIGYYVGQHPLIEGVKFTLVISGIDVINSTKDYTSYTGYIKTETANGHDWSTEDMKHSSIGCHGPKMNAKF